MSSVFKTKAAAKKAAVAIWEGVYEMLEHPKALKGKDVGDLKRLWLKGHNPEVGWQLQNYGYCPLCAWFRDLEEEDADKGYAACRECPLYNKALSLLSAEEQGTGCISFRGDDGCLHISLYGRVLDYIDRKQWAKAREAVKDLLDAIKAW